MNKKSFTLVEVLISVMLLSTVIATLLQIKNNNLNLLSNINEKQHFREYIPLLSFDAFNDTTNKDIYLSDKINFNDDDIRKKLKEIKVHIQGESQKPITFTTDEYIVNININKTTLSINNNISKSYYHFSIQ